MNRNKAIIKTGVLGIIMNITLVIFKTIVGIATNSIAIVLDAVNNFSDILSASISIIGTKLASKKADKEHPFGHGRIEYIASTIIAMIIFMAGVTALKEAIQKTIFPVETKYSNYSLIIISVAIIVKVLYGWYAKHIGNKVHAKILVVTGIDATFDAGLSSATLIAALLKIFYNVALEGPIGILISLIILKSSITILKDTFDDVIVTIIDSELSKRIKSFINDFDNVYGTYDLNLTNYGHDNMIGSAHIEIPEKMTAKEIHMLTKEISYKVFEKFGIILTIGIYATNDNDKEVKKIKTELETVIKKYPNIIQIHGFYLNKKVNTIYFDIVVDFQEENPSKLRKQIIQELKDKYPNYKYIVVIDADLSD